MCISYGGVCVEHVGTQTVRTDRLILRRYEMTDAQDMYRNWVTDPEVSRFWNWEPHKDIRETESLLAGWIDGYRDPRTYHWVIVLKDIMEAVGCIYLSEIDDVEGSVWVHFLLGRKFWNRGIMTEACGGVLQYAFRKMGVEKVKSRHHRDNPASGRVQQKCGMVYVGTVYKHHPDCERISGDYDFYEIGMSAYGTVSGDRRGVSER